MITDINSEGRLVQRAFADHLLNALRWESVYAHNDETFSPSGTLGRATFQPQGYQKHAVGMRQQAKAMRPRDSAFPHHVVQRGARRMDDFPPLMTEINSSTCYLDRLPSTRWISCPMGKFNACGINGNMKKIMIRDLANRPDFLWDESLSRDELKKLLDRGSEEERLYYAAKILREARFEEVWDYISPAFLAVHWEKLRSKLGRKKKFWEFFYATWRRQGLIP